MYWGISELSAHPEVTRKLRIELHQIADTPDEMTYLGLTSLPYLDAIVTEILRIHPPISTTSRIVEEDIIISDRNNNDILIPKDAILLSSMYHLHHDKQVWGDDVAEFIPERWLGVSKNAFVNRCEYLPFLGGPRNCPSAGFVVLQLKVMLAVLFFDSNVDVNNDLVEEIVGKVVQPSKATDYEVTRVKLG